ncbi:surface protease GP63 [Trypanosoma theileri]|uniref:Leishmanolysin-like peptidase n=1 Tax=Trypanosoma theileri TaxID=67003 RepID=A0A1X0P9Z4_9TRYP|nr:surface protease GP63 [Trypanosoma theileri]ORC93757.1 surface protease GP63 [Trypanosoma theileri]
MTRQMHVSLFLLLLLFLFVQLCSTSGILAAPSAGVVREVPLKGQGASQAYTVATENRKFIRIRAFYEDLTNDKYCTAVGELIKDFEGNDVECYANDVFTEEDISKYIDTIIPAAIKLHEDRLLVDPVDGPLIVPEFEENNVCNNITVPEDHHSKGVNDADMVLYVSARPVYDIYVICARNDDGRPIAGAINILPFAKKSQRYNVRIMAHEIAHVLGFDYNVFKNYSMVDEINFDDGRKRMLVKSSKTKEKVQEHYGCNTAQGMELEYEKYGNGKTVSSHWNYRVAKDDLMSSQFTVSGMYYSALTMSVFDDLPYYSANWGMEEPMAWGNKSNCDLLDNNFENAFVGKYPTMFCSIGKPYSCTTDRSAVGYCIPESRYTDSDGNEINAAFVRSELYNSANTGSMSCSDKVTSDIPGSIFDNDSFCLDTEEYTRVVGQDTLSFTGVCARVSCDGGKVKVMYAGDNKWYDCPEGNLLVPTSTSSFVSGKIMCPKYNEVCTVAPDGSSRRPMIYPPGYEHPTESPGQGGDGCVAPALLAPVVLFVMTLALSLLF